jgi:hypothetical protein
MDVELRCWWNVLTVLLPIFAFDYQRAAGRLGALLLWQEVRMVHCCLFFCS